MAALNTEHNTSREMFTRLRPQKVRHDSGYIVQIADRHSVEFVEGSRIARMTVAFGYPAEVFRDTLSGWWTDGICDEMSYSDRVRMLTGVAAGLRL